MYSNREYAGGTHLEAYTHQYTEQLLTHSLLGCSAVELLAGDMRFTLITATETMKSTWFHLGSPKTAISAF